MLHRAREVRPLIVRTRARFCCGISTRTVVSGAQVQASSICLHRLLARLSGASRSGCIVAQVERHRQRWRAPSPCQSQPRRRRRWLSSMSTQKQCACSPRYARWHRGELVAGVSPCADGVRALATGAPLAHRGCACLPHPAHGTAALARHCRGLPSTPTRLTCTSWRD